MKPVCIITGGGGGLGKGVCRAFAEDGFQVAIVDVDLARAESVANDLNTAGCIAFPYKCDITSAEEIAALQSDVVERFGRVDVLINLAGIARNAVLSKITEADFRLVLDSHVVGTLLMCREFGILMKKHGYGRIVNASSIASLGAVAGTSYSAAKGAIEAMTRSMAIELAPSGVTVNCVAPGVIDAGMFRQTPEEFQEKVLAGTPVGRIGTVDDIAACISFLSSKKAGFITGQTIFVCGGASIGAF